MPAAVWMYGCPEPASFTGQLIDLMWRSPFVEVGGTGGGALKANFEAGLTE